MFEKAQAFLEKLYASARNVEFSWPIQLSLDVANVVMFTITVFAVGLTVHQLRTDSRNEKRRDRDLRERHREEDARDRMIEKEASAKMLYMEYLKIAFNHPDLSTANYKRGDAESEDKYDSFLSIMLWTLDEGINVQEESWRPTLEDQIRVHEEYIRKTLSSSCEDPSFRKGYSEKTIAIVDATLDALAGSRLSAPAVN